MSAYREELEHTSGSTMRDGPRNDEEGQRRAERKKEQKEIDKAAKKGEPETPQEGAGGKH